jgi:hypothetical protein
MKHRSSWKTYSLPVVGGFFNDSRQHDSFGAELLNPTMEIMLLTSTNRAIRTPEEAGNNLVR